jgi:hypothetical protein
MPRRPWAWPVAVTLVALVASAALYAISTPRYALYWLGSAIERRDAGAALAFFDVDAIADHATAVLAADYLARQPAPASAAEANGRELLVTLARRRLRPLVAARIRADIERSVERPGGADRPAAMRLPVGALALVTGVSVSRDGSGSWISYQDPGQGLIRFRMARDSGRPWKITEFDPDWVRRKAREEGIRLH